MSILQRRKKPNRTTQCQIKVIEFEISKKCTYCLRLRWVQRNLCDFGKQNLICFFIVSSVAYSVVCARRVDVVMCMHAVQRREQYSIWDFDISAVWNVRWTENTHVFVCACISPLPLDTIWMVCVWIRRNKHAHMYNCTRIHPQTAVSYKPNRIWHNSVCLLSCNNAAISWEIDETVK